MSKILRLDGKSEHLIKMNLDIISATNVDPYYHISEIVQNEMDAGATDIKITFFRHGGSKKGKVKSIVIEGNGFGFLESFEHYRENIADSTKKYLKNYLDREAKGLSRGQFCIGLQGFRAICDELHLVNKTNIEEKPKLEGGRFIEDEDFQKMKKNRKMILRANNLDVEILEEDEFQDTRDVHGVTCTLINLKTDLKSANLIKFLSQNKRSELLANKKLNIVVIDGKVKKKVEPINYKGKKEQFTIEHPKANSITKYRGLGEIKATLYFHEEKSGSKISLFVNKEPIILNITNFENFDISPWNSNCVEGFIEYDLLTKSPLRSGVERDNVFYPAYVEMMGVLTKIVNKKVKQYEEKTRKKQDAQLNKKLEKVLGEVKRELEFWFDKTTKKGTDNLGPLDYIKIFTEVANVPAFTTKKLVVKAYDSSDKTLKEKDNIKFEWIVNQDYGKIIKDNDGEAIFKASSIIGATSVEVKVKDLITKKELSGQIEIAITHPPKRAGILVRVRVEPPFSNLPLGGEKKYEAIAEDEDRNPIKKEIKYYWKIAYDDSSGASINNEEGEIVVLKAGKNQGTIKLLVTAIQNDIRVEDFTVVTVIERVKKTDKKSKPKKAGIPYPEHYQDPTEYPLVHCKLNSKGTILFYNTSHPDYINADAKGSKFRQRYIANLYAKELGRIEAEANNKDYGEMILEVLSKIDRLW